MNVAPEEVDLANPKTNRGSPGFTDEEREDFRTYLKAGLRDVLRDRPPGEKGLYSWWSQRGGARAKNVGWRIDMFLMMAFSIVGVATGATNLWFIYKPRRAPHDWQKEHLKGLVGVGISVYTAFLAFGSVRLMPELALNPVMWSVPLAVGLGIILYHWFALDRAARQPRRRDSSQP